MNSRPQQALIAVGLILTLTGVLGWWVTRPAPALPSATASGTTAPPTRAEASPAIPAAATPSSPATPPGGEHPTTTPTVASSAEPAEEVPSSPAGTQPAVDQAVAFMTAYARPVGSQRAEWVKRVAPFLAKDVGASYTRPDPATIPFTNVSGPAAPLVGDAIPAPGMVQVVVPTDAGAYLVELDDKPPYLVHRLSRAPQ